MAMSSSHPLLSHRKLPADSSIDIGIEDIQDLSIDGENIELAEIQTLVTANIELGKLYIGDSNIELTEICDISIER
jgi:hypothetical protein